MNMNVRPEKFLNLDLNSSENSCNTRVISIFGGKGFRQASRRSEREWKAKITHVTLSNILAVK